MGPSSTFSKKRQSPPQFSAVSIVPKRLDGSRCHLAWSLDQGHTVHRWGRSSPSPKKGAQPPIFGPCLLCPNGWMDQHALGMEVGHGPGHMPDGNLLPFPEKGAQLPIFGACLLWSNGWMDQDATWYKDRPRPRPHCARWELAPLPRKGGTAPNFRPMFVVAKRLDGSRCYLVQR